MFDILKIREILDREGTFTYLEGDTRLVFDVDPDDSFPFMLRYFIFTGNNGYRLCFGSFAPDWDPVSDKLMLANMANENFMMPATVVRDGRIGVEYSFFIDEEVSDEYIEDVVIDSTLRFIRETFIFLFEKDLQIDK